MRTKAVAVVFSLFALGMTAAPVFADDNPTGLPDNPNTIENVIPGPEATNPTDPAAADSAAARVPTTEDEAAQLKANKKEAHEKKEAYEVVPAHQPPK
jgi:hypothetical protein